MKIISKIILFFLIIFSLNSINQANSSLFVKEWNIEWLNSVAKSKVNDDIIKKWSLKEKSEKIWVKTINIIRWIFSWILVIFMVYAGFEMMNSWWTDDDSLKKAKNSLWYAIIWLIFVNFPVEIYNAIAAQNNNTKWNLFIFTDNFNTIIWDILTAIEYLIWWVAIFILVLEWIKLIANSKDPEAFKKASKKIQWSIIWLIFLWFIHLWIIFLKSWNLKDWVNNIFEPVANLLLYLAWPIALFFLWVAWYYYIFSGWDEDKTKKWKDIIINTSIWVIIILCIYVLLNDIKLLNF